MVKGHRILVEWVLELGRLGPVASAECLRGALDEHSVLFLGAPRTNVELLVQIVALKVLLSLALTMSSTFLSSSLIVSSNSVSIIVCFNGMCSKLLRKIS